MMALGLPESEKEVDRLAAVLLDLLDQLEKETPSSRSCFKPAGIPVEIHSNIPELALKYAGRLPAAGREQNGSSFRLYLLKLPAGETAALSDWTAMACVPKTFHRVMAGYGLRVAYPYRRNVRRILHAARGIGALIISHEADLDPWEFGAPFRQHLHWILQINGMRLAHAATLSYRGRGVLLVGSSGMGKSGITLAGVAHGLQTAGDDYVALAVGGQVTARHIFTIIKQDREGLSYLPELAARCTSMPANWKGKLELSATELGAEAFTPAIRIVATVLPCVAGVVRPETFSIDRSDVMRALMPSNLHQFPGEEDDGMRFFGRLLRLLPAFKMNLSRNFAANAAEVKSLISSV